MKYERTTTTVQGPCTAFSRHKRLTSGPLDEIAVSLKNQLDREPDLPLLVFEDATCRQIDIDFRGSPAEVLARIRQSMETPTDPEAAAPRGRGRPRLGVVGREVTLLPRHWEWLDGQPGGASVTLRKLVEKAKRDHAMADRHRESREAIYRFITVMAGDEPGYEEAVRTVFATDADRLKRFRKQTQTWPADVRDFAVEKFKQVLKLERELEAAKPRKEAD